MAKVKISSLGVQLGKSELLRDVSVSIPEATVTSIVGPNGAGKSSLLKTIGGELTISQGDVLLNNMPIQEQSIIVRSASLAMLPQQSLLDFPFLVSEVIRLGRYPCHTSKHLDEGIVSEIAEDLELTRLLDRRYTTLSGGEKQRVQIARVLAQLWDKKESALYMFDEPTAPLDLRYQLLFADCVRRLADKGATVIIAIHDLNLAARVSDKMLLLSNGNVVAEGEPAEVLQPLIIQTGFNVSVRVDLSEEGIPYVRF